MISYREIPEDFTKMLELISDLGKVTGHNIKIWKSMGFLNTDNELFEREITKQCHQKNKIINSTFT